MPEEVQSRQEQSDALRALSIQYALPLVKTQISGQTIDDLKRNHPDLGNSGVLYQVVENYMTLDRILEFIRYVRPDIERSVYESLIDEFEEMETGLKWSQSDEGQIILLLEKWVLEAREELAEYSEYETVFVGRSYADPSEVIVSGLLANDADIAELKSFIDALAPKREVRFELETWP